MDVQSNPRLYAIRHSLAHVMAQAIQKLFPGTQLGFGPPTETGFYYDFDLGEKSLTEKDFAQIEKQMRQIIREKQNFVREDMDFEKIQARYKKQNEPYKLQNIEMLHGRGVKNFSVYSNGAYEDLCEGPHVANTGDLPEGGFKLDRIAGAYWLGKESNKMLTRIYALAFETEKELKEFIKRREIAEQFDHKKLGRELGIFYFDDMIGKGLPLWLPNGFVVRDQVETYVKEMEFKAGYKRVATPPIAKKELYLTSQHLPAYEDSMFPPMVCKHADTGYEEQFYLRPMNCPHHHLVYKSSQRSYRDLPLRLAEYGSTFRYEQSGELSGLLRVRSMTMNDAHIYVRADQLEDEFQRTLTLYKDMYECLKIRDYRFRLSLPDLSEEKYKGTRDMWDKAGKILENLLEKNKVPYYMGVGEAAFYGPKLDIQFKYLLGREETVSTIQLDFLSADNFDLTYIDEQGKSARPVIIHRAPFSTHERFISYILEYYGGVLPTWMSPVQVVFIPVNDACHAYCQSLADEWTQNFVRVEVDTTQQSFGKKIRTHTVRKVPILLIVGNKEVEEGNVTVRRYGVEQQETLKKDEFAQLLYKEIRERINTREPLSSIV